MFWRAAAPRRSPWRGALNPAGQVTFCPRLEPRRLRAVVGKREERPAGADTRREKMARLGAHVRVGHGAKRCDDFAPIGPRV
jgi:hypothetical protein